MRNVTHPSEHIVALRSIQAWSLAAILGLSLGCSPDEPAESTVELPETNSADTAELVTVELSELPAEYVQVPGINVAVRLMGSGMTSSSPPVAGRYGPGGMTKAWWWARFIFC